MNDEESGLSGMIAVLRGLDLLSPFPDEQLTVMASVVEKSAFHSGQVIYDEGSEGTDFLLIGGGAVQAIRNTPVGPQTVATLGPGQVCGEISLLDGKPRSTSIVGTEDGFLLRFDTGGIAKLIADQSSIEVLFLRIFCRSLAQKIRQANQVMTQIMAPDTPDDRVAMGARGEKDRMGDDIKRQILREQGMTSADLQQLAAYLEAERFASGEPIFVEGESGDKLFIVAEGRVRISRHIPGMGEEALAILDRGEVFGEMAWIDSSPRSADAVAHTGGCTVLGISRQHLNGTLDARAETHGHFLKLLCQILCRRIRNMNDQLVAYRTMAFF